MIMNDAGYLLAHIIWWAYERTTKIFSLPSLKESTNNTKHSKITIRNNWQTSRKIKNPLLSPHLSPLLFQPPNQINTRLVASKLKKSPLWRKAPSASTHNHRPKRERKRRQSEKCSLSKWSISFSPNKLASSLTHFPTKIILPSKKHQALLQSGQPPTGALFAQLPMSQSSKWISPLSRHRKQNASNHQTKNESSYLMKSETQHWWFPTMK